MILRNIQGSQFDGLAPELLKWLVPARGRDTKICDPSGDVLVEPT